MERKKKRKGVGLRSLNNSKGKHIKSQSDIEEYENITKSSLRKLYGFFTSYISTHLSIYQSIMLCFYNWFFYS